ncbi:hypothetical protein PUR29_25765 [Methylobacterium ajmalii]|uniref:ATPase dynein-related AAA domain-containing protein n=2 Tax=Methylobacterium TaxID=407 RepID=A0ABV0A0D4_9HYPH
MTTDALDGAEAYSAHAIMRGVCPAPTRADPHPFEPLVRYVLARWPRSPRRDAPTADLHWDEALPELAGSACTTVYDLVQAPKARASAAARIAHTRVLHLRPLLAARAEALEAGPFLMDVDLDYNEPAVDHERAVLECIRLAQSIDVSLVGTGDRAAFDRLAGVAEFCLMHRIDGYLQFSVGARALLASQEGLGEWRPGGPPLPLIRRALETGQEILARQSRAREAATLRETQGGNDPTDDDRAEVVRLPAARPKAVPAAPARAAVPPAEPDTGLSLRVFPSLRHLPLPSQMARDRGDSPRALCEPVAEVALPLVPAPDPATVAATMNAAFPWAAEVTEQYAQDLVGAPYAMLKPRTLVGGMGGAKTSYARALLRAVGLPEVLYSAAGVMDGGNFAGASRTWSTWRLSVPAQGVLRFRSANLGVIVDEAEKAGPSRRWGRLDETLLAFLERASTARAIMDPALEVPIDLSGISYILTANERHGMSGPLLDRAPPVQWPMPRREDLPVAAAAILDDIRRERGLSETWCPALDGNELDALTAWRGGSLRPLRRMVEAVVASRDHFARAMPN